MVRKLIAWALDNPIVVILAALFLAVGRLLFVHERQRRGLPRPGAGDRRGPRPVPGASAEEVERQVTIPLEVTFCRHARPEEDPQQVAVRPVATSR